MPNSIRKLTLTVLLVALSIATGSRALSQQVEIGDAIGGESGGGGTQRDLHAKQMMYQFLFNTDSREFEAITGKDRTWFVNLVQNSTISFVPFRPKVNGVEKDAKNFPSSQSMQIWEKFWTNSDFMERLRLLIHEYLGLARVPDRDGIVTHKLLATRQPMLQVTRSLQLRELVFKHLDDMLNAIIDNVLDEEWRHPESQRVEARKRLKSELNLDTMTCHAHGDPNTGTCSVWGNQLDLNTDTTYLIMIGTGFRDKPRFGAFPMWEEM